MNSAEHHQQELEQQQYEADMEAAAGEPAIGICDGHICRTTPWNYDRKTVTIRTPEGMRIKFGDQVDSFLSQPLNGEGITLDDVGRVSLCGECEADPDWMWD